MPSNKLIPVPEAALRGCLSCGVKFLSVWCGNRICPCCDARIAKTLLPRTFKLCVRRRKALSQ
jgi:hypothetical protein